jgi:hypothetical protein
MNEAIFLLIIGNLLLTAVNIYRNKRHIDEMRHDIESYREIVKNFINVCNSSDKPKRTKTGKVRDQWGRYMTLGQQIKPLKLRIKGKNGKFVNQSKFTLHGILRRISSTK